MLKTTFTFKAHSELGTKKSFSNLNRLISFKNRMDHHPTPSVTAPKLIRALTNFAISRETVYLSFGSVGWLPAWLRRASESDSTMCVSFAVRKVFLHVYLKFSLCSVAPYLTSRNGIASLPLFTLSTVSSRCRLVLWIRDGDRFPLRIMLPWCIWVCCAGCYLARLVVVVVRPSLIS